MYFTGSLVVVTAFANIMAASITDPEVERAVAAFKAGQPCMIFDSAFRECETDLLWPAEAASPEVMRQLRRDCGGLLFLAIGHDVGEMFGLPFLQDLHTMEACTTKHPVLSKLITNDLQYDSRSAFTLSLNHRQTFTGITDKDRALTTRRFAELSKSLIASNATPERCVEELGKEFRTPGHIPLCRESPKGLASRQGHTELAVAIARLAGVAPCTIGAEMLQPDGDKALPVADARKYAEAHGYPMITGEQLLKALGLPSSEADESASKKAKLAS